MRCIMGDVQKASSPRICHRSELTEKAWENALLGLGKNGRSSRIRHPNALTEKAWGDAAHRVMQQCKCKQLFDPVTVLQKKAVRMINFSQYTDDHTSILFRDLTVFVEFHQKPITLMGF